MKKYTYENLLEIIRILRSGNGCPWDREQTHQSLKPCMMEEAAEVLSAIRIYDKTGNYENLEEELGDVLLQVVMHARIAEEEGLFTMEDIVHGISEKMIRRHPHVFADSTVDNSMQVLENWEDIKKKEKEGKSYVESPLREIPIELPSLARAPKVLKKVDKLYEGQSSYQESVDSLLASAKQLQALETQEETPEITQIIGDILMSVSNISRLFKLPQEQILYDRIEDMIEKCEERWEKI